MSGPLTQSHCLPLPLTSCLSSWLFAVTVSQSTSILNLKFGSITLSSHLLSQNYCDSPCFIGWPW